MMTCQMFFVNAVIKTLSYTFFKYQQQSKSMEIVIK